MKIRMFQAADREEVLSLVREALGDEAIVLETRRSSSGDGRSRWTAVAAVDEGPSVPPTTKSPRDRGTEIAGDLFPSPDLAQELQSAQDTIRYLSRLVSSEHTSSLTPPARELYLDLLQAELDPGLSLGVVMRLSRSAGENGSVTRDLLSDLARRVRTGRVLDPDRPGRQIAAFVGSSGAGKTTTVAKLAARLRDRGSSVGLVSYAPAGSGVHHLLGPYGAILGLPVHSAGTPDSVRRLLGEQLAATSMVLIDTPGHLSPRALEDLAALTASVPEMSTHITVAATARITDQIASAARFASCGVDALSFTKLDETDRFGCLLTLPLKTELPVAYLCDGPRIPEDLRPAGIAELVDRITAGFSDPSRDIHAATSTGSLHEARRAL